MFEKPIIEKKEKLSPREVLLKLEKEGIYVFHGSPRKNDELEPRQSEHFNTAKNIVEEHGKPAVSATQYADIAIFRAITSPRNYEPGHYFTTFGFDSEKNEFNFSANKEVFDKMRGKSGYIYVFKKEDFNEFDEIEYRSEKAVKPITVIDVTGSDLPERIVSKEK